LEGSRINSQGILIIDARKFRTRERNRQDALERLAAIVKRASARPRPRLKTSPPPQSRQIRLDGKRRLAQKKTARSKPSQDE
jgi:ribosome-associated protein